VPRTSRTQSRTGITSGPVNGEAKPQTVEHKEEGIKQGRQQRPLNANGGKLDPERARPRSIDSRNASRTRSQQDTQRPQTEGHAPAQMTRVGRIRKMLAGRPTTGAFLGVSKAGCSEA